MPECSNANTMSQVFLGMGVLRAGCFCVDGCHQCLGGLRTGGCNVKYHVWQEHLALYSAHALQLATQPCYPLNFSLCNTAIRNSAQLL
jgi:hypothetical protein